MRARCSCSGRVTPLDYDHRDVARQKDQLRGRVQRDVRTTSTAGWIEVEHTPTFYFDAITQLELTSWSRGRVTLVGDAGYCPGPAVGGSTSLAVYGAYVLAGEIAKARGDPVAAFAGYEATMSDPCSAAVPCQGQRQDDRAR